MAILKEWADAELRTTGESERVYQATTDTVCAPRSVGQEATKPVGEQIDGTYGAECNVGNA